MSLVGTTVARNCEVGIRNDGTMSLDDGSGVSMHIHIGVFNFGALTLRDSSVTDHPTGITNRKTLALEDGSRVTRNKLGISNAGSLTISADSSVSGNEEIDCEDVPPNGAGCPGSNA